jgi:septum formation topological specificity factor MinE
MTTERTSDALENIDNEINATRCQIKSLSQTIETAVKRLQVCIFENKKLEPDVLVPSICVKLQNDVELYKLELVKYYVTLDRLSQIKNDILRSLNKYDTSKDKTFC